VQRPAIVAGGDLLLGPRGGLGGEVRVSVANAVILSSTASIRASTEA